MIMLLTFNTKYKWHYGNGVIGFFDDTMDFSKYYFSYIGDISSDVRDVFISMNRASPELRLIGCNKGSNLWNIINLDEGSEFTMPLSKGSMEDMFPIGVAIDITSCNKIANSEAQLEHNHITPIITIYTNKSEIISLSYCVRNPNTGIDMKKKRDIIKIETPKIKDVKCYLYSKDEKFKNVLEESYGKYSDNESG